MSSRTRTWLAIYARALGRMARGEGPAADPPRRILLPHHSLLGDTILREFKLRLERIGIDYQTPLRPVA